MQYHQHRYQFENTNLVKISSESMDFAVNYVDMLDQTCVEFEHKHESSFEIYYCLSGVHHLYIDGNTYTLTEKSFAIIRPDTLHHTVYEPDLFKQYVVFVFNEPTLKKGTAVSSKEALFQEFLDYFSECSHCVIKDQYDSYAILQRVQREIDQPAPLKDLMIQHLYMEYLICIIRHFADGHAAEPPQISANTNLAVLITKYLHDNYHKKITLQDVSDYFYISPRHVNRIINSYFGTTFKQMLDLYRFNYAKNYLIDTDYPIEQISELVGFSSPKKMYQMFRSHEHMTVSKYREEYRRKQAEDNNGLQKKAQQII